MDAIDLSEQIDRVKENTVTISSSGTGDLFYELTAVEYLRAEAVISIPEEINGTAVGDEVIMEVSVDPKNSEAVDLIDAEIIISDTEEYTILYVEEVRPELDDDVWIFKVCIMPLTHGDIKITPIIASYRLTAGYGESGVIRRFFGPVVMKIDNKIAF